MASSPRPEPQRRRRAAVHRRRFPGAARRRCDAPHAKSPARTPTFQGAIGRSPATHFRGRVSHLPTRLPGAPLPYPNRVRPQPTAIATPPPTGRPDHLVLVPAGSPPGWARALDRYGVTDAAVIESSSGVPIVASSVRWYPDPRRAWGGPCRATGRWSVQMRGARRDQAVRLSWVRDVPDGAGNRRMGSPTSMAVPSGGRRHAQ
jgi:hypothetical protein